jgi:hypothetical protein
MDQTILTRILPLPSLNVLWISRDYSIVYVREIGHMEVIWTAQH